MLGRGGAEEESIAQVAARALGSAGQLREIAAEDIEKDLETTKRGQIWTADEFVPGAREHSIVIFSAITGNNHFDMRAVTKRGNATRRVENMIIDSSGFHKTQNLVLAKNRRQKCDRTYLLNLNI